MGHTKNYNKILKGFQCLGLGLGLSVLLLCPHLALSAPILCTSYADLDRELTSCDENEDLGNAALVCVQAYYNHVQAAQAEVRAKFQAQIEAMKQEQSDTYNRTSGGYDDTSQKLKVLIEEGHIARASVDSLNANLFFPPDYDEPGITGMSSSEYLATEPCFAVPTKVMKQSQAMIDKMVGDLTALEAATRSKESRSNTRSAKVQVIVPNRKVGNTVGKGSGKVIPFESGKQRVPASDITGTEKKPSKIPSQ